VPDPVRCAKCGATRAELPGDWAVNPANISRAICADCLSGIRSTALREAQAVAEWTFKFWCDRLVNNALVGPERGDPMEGHA